MGPFDARPGADLHSFTDAAPSPTRTPATPARSRRSLSLLLLSPRHQRPRDKLPVAFYSSARPTVEPEPAERRRIHPRRGRRRPLSGTLGKKTTSKETEG